MHKAIVRRGPESPNGKGRRRRLLATGAIVTTFTGMSIAGLAGATSANASGWSSWTSLGGATSQAPSAVTVGGHTDVFATGTNGHLYEADNSNGSFGSWYQVAGSGTITSAPSAVTLSTGEVDVFGTASNGSVYETRYIPGSGWSSWTSLGGTTSQAPSAVTVGGHIDVFATGTDGHLWETDNSNGSFGSWYQVAGSGTITSAPSAIAFSSGNVDVFGTASNGSVYETSYVAPTPSTPQAYAQAYMLQNYGWGDTQFNCLDNVWTHESGWQTTATNPAGGDPNTSAYGIPQALPGSKMASYGADWQTNPQTQIRWGLNYIYGRYSTPCGAWTFWQANGWY